MKVLKALLGVLFAAVLLVGCKGGEKKTDKSEAAAVSEGAAGQGPSVSVADIFAKKDELNGKNVTLSGKVVKVNLGIMGKNWIHLQDGTGAQGTNDITITTEGTAAVDDKVVVTGTVVTDKDFGSGYKYDVIIENGMVTVQ